MNKLRLKENKELVRGLKPSEWVCWGLNPGNVAPESAPLTHRICSFSSRTRRMGMIFKSSNLNYSSIHALSM